MSPLFSKEFFFEYFNGNATSLQKKQIDTWILDPDNEEQFFQYLEEWEILHPQYPVNLEPALNKYRELFEDADKFPPAPVTRAPVPSPFRNLFPHAAAVLLLLGMLGWLYQEPLLFSHYRTLPGEVASWTLDDGSKVTLNANSQLKVPRWWRFAPTRVVYLEGEAAFDVVHTQDDRKFIVKTDNQVDVVVLGTVFTVFNRHHKTQIVLNSGKILLEHRKGQVKEAITMQPGDQVRVDTSGILQKQALPKSILFAPWKEKLFVFDETPLSEIIQLLKDHYRLNAGVTSPELANLTVSGSFTALNADEFLNSLADILDIEYTRNRKNVTFKLNP